MLTPIIEQKNIDKVSKYIEQSDQIVIVTHISPDGDAMGSSLGFADYLQELGKKVYVVVPNFFPSFLRWMPGAKSVIVYSALPDLAEMVIKKADLIFGLDFNVLKRIENVGEYVSQSSACKILVDHHLYPSTEWDVTISHSKMSSTSELIFRLICRMGDYERITRKAAECIYTGMMTDTGSFTYNSNSPEIYFIISELIRKGIQKDELYAKVYNNYSADRIRLQGYLLSQRMKVYEEYPAVLMTLLNEDCKRYNYQIGDAEGFVNIPLSIKDIVLSVFMREDEDKIKISLRSRGTFPCNEVAAQCFNGGGHLNASGGEFYGTMEEAVKILEEALPAYKSFFESK